MSEPRATAEGGAPSASKAPLVRTPSRAASWAILLCVWGQSLLLFDWARTEFFSANGRTHLWLVVPFFVGAALAGSLAAWVRLRGHPSLGGGRIHALGVASGLLGLLGASLFTWLTPWVEGEGVVWREQRAQEQLELLAVGLALHRMKHGTYPIGFGPETLSSALVPEFIPSNVPETDPWGRPLHYQSLSLGQEYLLLSSGPDGARDLLDSQYVVGAAGLVDDLAVVTGRFVRPLRQPLHGRHTEAASPLTGEGRP